MDGPADSVPAERAEVAGSLRELLVVAVPLVISSGSLSLMHVVDRMMLTWYSESALAASTPGGLLHWTLMSFPFGIVTYVNTFISQYDGAGRKERVASSIWQGLWLAVAGGVLLGVAATWAGELTRLFRHAPDIQQQEAQYFSVLALGSLPALTSAALANFFSGRGRTKVLMVVNIVIAIANGIVNWVLIFGAGPFPELGIRGAACGTVCAQLLGCLLYVAWMRIDREARTYPFRQQLRFDTELLQRMLRYGLPNGVQFLVDVGAYLLLLIFIGQIGSRELAATTIAFTLNSLAFIPLFGIGTAVTILVGRRVGEGEPRLAIRTTWLAFGLASAYMGFWACMYLFGQKLILAPFASHSDPEAFAQLRPVVETLLVYIALYSFFDAMAVVFGSAIRGAGDTQFSLIYTGVVLWTAMVLPVWWISRTGGGLYACWTVLIVQLSILGSGFLARFLQGRWLTMKVIEHAGVGANVPAIIEEPGPMAVVSNVGLEDVLAETRTFDPVESASTTE
ncbi:MAG: MATE family efflux transporter [Planctomycetaceae bacterium]|nr:MATE family efflux transporter [Planctomycetaceae bacterium]